MDIHLSPKRPREAAQGNMVSQSATSNASVKPESEPVCADSFAAQSTCQSLPEPCTSHHHYGSVS
eukprot:scaffold1542_cov140-Isochrysis_galbana.AAC.1